jgi:hypothetical protein
MSFAGPVTVQIVSKYRKQGALVFFTDLSQVGLPITPDHPRFELARDILASEKRSGVTAGHWGSGPAPSDADLLEFDADRIWRIELLPGATMVRLSQVKPATGATFYFAGANIAFDTVWTACEAPEAQQTSIGRQRSGTNDRGEGMPDAPGHALNLVSFKNVTLEKGSSRYEYSRKRNCPGTTPSGAAANRTNPSE